MSQKNDTSWVLCSAKYWVCCTIITNHRTTNTERVKGNCKKPRGWPWKRRLSVMWRKISMITSSSKTLGGLKRISILLGLTGRFCSSAVVPYKFPLWKQSPSLCPSQPRHQIFISIKLSHCSTSKLVDRLHSYEVTRDKLDESRMMRGVVVIPDRVRHVDTLKPPLAFSPFPLLWPLLLLVTFRFSVLSVMATELGEAGLAACWTN